jgi:hypothetical protein
MIRSSTRGALALSTALAMCGCALKYDSTALGVPVSLAEAAQAPPPSGEAFNITRHAVFLVWGVWTVGAPNLEDVLAGQVGAATGVTNLRIRQRVRWSDLLITVLTVGIVSPRSITMEGVVVQEGRDRVTR